MDEGRYGEAEVSYGKALAYDAEILVGKSVLARLTLNLDERNSDAIRLKIKTDAAMYKQNRSSSNGTP